jgi:Lrp/AsnC family transcriptional regulator for asnA, asnC and gidA
MVRYIRMTTNHVRLDETDKEIIAHLQDDGRMPFSNLGPAVGLSPAAVRQRVLHLVSEGFMQIVAVTDPTTFGFAVQALVGIKVKGDLGAAAKALAEIPEIDYVVIVTGRFDIMIEVVVEDTDRLLDLMNEVRSIGSIASTEVFNFLRLEKQTYNWGTR